MDDIRLKTADVTIGGYTYKISCNMNVLADVQEIYNGDMRKALNDSSAKGIRNFLTAMINDARDSLGKEPLTNKQIGREISFNSAKEIVLPLILSAFTSGNNTTDKNEKETGDKKT